MEILHGVYMLRMSLTKSPHYRKYCVFDGLLNIFTLTLYTFDYTFVLGLSVSICASINVSFLELLLA